MNKVILTERYRSSSHFWPNLIIYKKIPELSVEQILNTYQGFEGDLYALNLIDEKDSESNEIVQLFLETKKTNDFFMLYIDSDFKEIPKMISEQTTFVGFDVGICEEERTIYSSIFNEILFGGVDELIAFKYLLNENFLFADRSIAEQYIDIHKKMDEQGKDVEHETMRIYGIWKLNQC